jgi:hypothetical protein
MNDRVFLYLFYIFLVVFVSAQIHTSLFWLFPQRFPLQFPFTHIPFLSSAIGVYVVTYIIFIIIKNYATFKKLYDSGLELIRKKLIDKPSTIRQDLYRFVMASLLITFFAELFFASVREESIFSLIPGLDVVQNILTASPNYPSTIKAGEIQAAVSYIAAPPLGAIVLFILRQARYKEVRDNINSENYPGSRILLLFFIFVPILIVFNILNIVYHSALTRSWSTEAFFTTYEPILNFLLSTIMNPITYFLVAATCILDWYLFSHLWRSA